MKKKELLLSTLILSQTINAVAVPGTSYDMGHFEADERITLRSSPFSIHNKLYRLVLKMEHGRFWGERSGDHNQTIFDFVGTALFYSQEDHHYFLAGIDDGDGNMVFQRIASNNGITTYQGAYCNSSLRGCTEFEEKERFLLIHDEINDTWQALLSTTLKSGNYSSQEAFIEIPNLLLVKEER